MTARDTPKSGFLPVARLDEAPESVFPRPVKPGPGKRTLPIPHRID